MPTFTLKMPADLKDLIRRASMAEDMNLSLWVRRTLKREAMLVLGRPRNELAYSEKQHAVNSETGVAT